MINKIIVDESERELLLQQIEQLEIAKEKIRILDNIKCEKKENELKDNFNKNIKNNCYYHINNFDDKVKILTIVKINSCESFENWNSSDCDKLIIFFTKKPRKFKEGERQSSLSFMKCGVRNDSLKKDYILLTNEKLEELKLEGIDLLNDMFNFFKK